MSAGPRRFVVTRHDGLMRAEVAESWRRSAAAGVDTETTVAPLTMPDGDLRHVRASHPLARVFPLLDDVVGQAARESNAIMAVSDAAGQLLWVAGTSRALRDAESIGFVEGSNWDERLAGTNAPGLAIKLNRTATVVGTEHFRRSVRRWNCAATPIRDPHTSAVLGALDITGGEEIIKPQTVALIRAAARMAESEMVRQLVSPHPLRPSSIRGSLHVQIESLGRAGSVVTVQDGGSKPEELHLSRRHSEIVLLLASAPRGLSGDELAVHLYQDDNGDSTLRAELNRLRHLLGSELLRSRPYRLNATVAGDWLAIEALLSAGEVHAAYAAYKGPLLVGSDAPGVVSLRSEVETSLRQAIIQSGDAELMSNWTRSWWGSDDYDVWVALRAAIAPFSPFMPLVQGQIARLDQELGAGENAFGSLHRRIGPSTAQPAQGTYIRR
ncbi:transcriptional regulator [Williamsia soli]|uniref:transcriptional regulator n=1 Tax=Williamsia soli TaxID=364929 RepID=UPI001A9F2B15|nr:transcriptional regulator [Williamsia soli]